jgi:hypothetical protein
MSRRAAEAQNELFDLIFRHVTAAGAGSVVDDAANDVVLCKPKSETPSSTSVAAIPPSLPVQSHRQGKQKGEEPR